MTEVTIPIRSRDVDNYGHVNNAVYLTYLEEARDRWVRATLGPEVDFVIVRIAIDYRRSSRSSCSSSSSPGERCTQSTRRTWRGRRLPWRR